MSNLYKSLESLCKKRGITAYRMCKDVGIQPSIMTDLKKGRRSSVKVETDQRIADYFEVSVAELLGNENVKKAPSAEDGDKVTFDDFTYAMYKEAHELTAEEKDKLLELARFFNENRKKGK